MFASRKILLFALLGAAGAGLGLGACMSGAEEFDPGEFTLPDVPSDYDPVDSYAVMPIPDDNRLTKAKARLGWQLFFDSRLSGDGSRSCYSCHLNDKGLSDGRPVAVGAYNKTLTRNSPTLWNIGYHTSWYWDGRADSLEGQAFAAWKGGNMGAGDRIPEIVEEINSLPDYADQFEHVFGGPATKDNIPQALASYMRTIISYDTPFDRWQQGDEGAVSDAAKRGYEVFQKAKCTNCHIGVMFTDFQFHNVGIGMDVAQIDVGHEKVSGREKDRGAFKTPTLRDVVDSGPYFHNGSVSSLEEAVKIMVSGGIDNPHLDKANLQPAELTSEEFQDLLEFLKSLDEPTKLEIPKLPSR